MRILFLTQVLPYPLDAGPKIRAYYTLRYLASHHEVTLLSFRRAEDPPAAIAHLEDLCEDVTLVPLLRSRVVDFRHLLWSLPRKTPFLIARDRVPQMRREVRRLVRREPPFDAVHADQLWMAPYARLASEESVRAHGRPLAVVLDQHNALFQIPLRLAQHEPNPSKRLFLRLESRKLVAYEQMTCEWADQVVWVTEEDRRALEAHGSDQSAATVIPICVAPDPEQRLPRAEGVFRVTFLGGLHWPPNAAGILWFARHVWPLVVEHEPAARLTVIGKSPPAELLALRDRWQQQHRPSIDVLGYVDDPTPVLAESAVFVVPLHAGGGMRIKILDAWNWGIPVISTSIGAEGIAIENGVNIRLADTPSDFAGAVRYLLRNPAAGRELADAAFETLQAAYDWRVVYAAWDDVYRRAQSSVPNTMPLTTLET